MNVNTITLDVSKEPAHEPTLYLGQSDKNGTTLVVNLFDNGAVLDLTDLTATFCMRTPGGSDYYQAVGTVSGNVATFLIDETYAAGHVGATDIAYVKIADGDTVITSTSRIHVVVLPSATEGVEPAPAYQTLIDQFIEEAQADVDEIIDAAEQVLEDGIPLMSADTRGGAKLGSSFGIDPYSEKLALKAATPVRIGGFKIGEGVNMDAYDCLNIKKASTSTLGGVKVDGTTITADSDGTIHGASTYELPPATTSTLGGVKVDGTTVTVDNDGTIHGASTYTLPSMAADTKGGAKLGSGLRVDDDVLSVGNLVQSGSGAEVVTDGCAIYSVEGNGWAEQDGTPTPDNPQEIKVARGRNLAEPVATANRSSSGVTWTYIGNGEWRVSGATGSGGTSFPDANSKAYMAHLEAGSYVASIRVNGVPQLGVRVGVGSSATFVGSSTNGTMAFTVSADGDYYILPFVPASTSVSGVVTVQLELGSTPTPYVPYGYIGLDVYDSQGAHVSTTPIPLPSKGFAASLPDGTADALSVDSAGRWEWANDVARIASYNGESVGNVYLSTTGQLTTGAEVYYKSAQAGEHGYIDLPDLPEGATVSIPELKQIGVSWFVQGVDELAKHAANWGARALASESRIAALESAVAELATS